ncbi:NAD(P)-dependent oxidoreductase [Pseudomonas sp. S1Bt23]|uniref:NAD-dependent epimerase/dehydratase family protein n=1 Tax=Pseudomonas sp. S1Bt23 TaxID=3095074 RepID=UPI002A5A6E75|nr:NAD(P)-dependent oxidoreductase [Pseudomonas sp. S1Bt23]WPO46848.1 NAD(P)-dependent oxidoreductase [Pseudomonas sp. S1Bt23]
MKILLVGGNSSLAQVLHPVLASFAEVLTAGRSDCDVTLDLSEPIERWCLPQNIDVVVNIAAHFGGVDFNAMLEAEHVNVLGGLKLCHAALNAGAQHFVGISSINAYLDRSSEYYGIYGLSKQHADELIQLYCSKVNLPCTLLRPSQLYGELDSFRRHQLFLYGTLDKVLRNEDIVIYGSRDARRNYLHSEDLCRIISAVIRGRVEGLYACTSQEDASLLTVANALIKAVGSTSNVTFNASMNDLSDNVFPYDDTLYRKTGTYPAIGIEQGLARLVASRLVTL